MKNSEFGGVSRAIEVPPVYFPSKVHTKVDVNADWKLKWPWPLNLWPCLLSTVPVTRPAEVNGTNF